jgi:trehalose 6-phosphate synthase
MRGSTVAIIAASTRATRPVETLWTAARLRRTLERNITAGRVIVVSNREPCVHDVNGDGAIVASRPVSGLVTALDPVLRATGGTWVAHGSGSADRATVDGRDRVQIRGEDGAYTLRRVWLSRGEERGYYHGFANSALWPLCHIASEAPRFTRNDWRHYQDVNRRFADAVAVEAGPGRPIVFVHDYHFALLPQLIRERISDATIVAFWHIPWPNAARYARLPYREEILDGLLGSDIVGFQTPEHAGNFLDCVETSLDAAVDRNSAMVGRAHGPVSVRAYPISVEWPSRWAELAPAVSECRRTIRAELEIEPDAPVMLSVDRLDYTKGIEERLTAIGRLLARGNATVGRPVFVQIAAPSRLRLERYRALGERVRSQVAAINERFGSRDYRPVVHIERQVEPSEVFRFYRAADACHVNSLDDGMNLVAKEFVSARYDGQGVLLLSRFAGAARELAGAVLVNPYDVDNVADSIANALTMTPDDQARRMRSLRARVAENNVYRWAGRLLLDAAAARTDCSTSITAMG